MIRKKLVIERIAREEIIKEKRRESDLSCNDKGKVELLINEKE